jgi:hypothetical protein
VCACVRKEQGCCQDVCELKHCKFTVVDVSRVYHISESANRELRLVRDFPFLLLFPHIKVVPLDVLQPRIPFAKIMMYLGKS